MAHILQSPLQLADHVFLDDDTLLVEVLDDEVMVLTVDVHDDGLDGGIALDQHACCPSVSAATTQLGWCFRRPIQGPIADGPLMARGIVLECATTGVS